MQRECKHHGITEFTEGNHPRCKSCAVEAVQKRRDKVKQMSIVYKGSSCSICGYDKCIDALEFHHIDPSMKDFGISEKGYTRAWNIVKDELDKCILVCANCHRELHYSCSKTIFNPKTIFDNYEPTLCKCGKQISHGATQCEDCYHISNRKVERPNQEHLLHQIKELGSFVQVGKYYGVSDKSIINWLRSYNLPSKKSEIIRYINNN